VILTNQTLKMKIALLMLTGLLSANSIYTQVRLPGIFGDHMVIQRSQPIPVWGWSTPNDKVVVTFNHQTKETIADHNGNWRVNLDPELAGGPYDLNVQGRNNIKFYDVLVGEVWLCSGQSNMEFELKSALNKESEIQGAIYPEIRQIKIPTSVSTSPKDDIAKTAWKICSPQTAPDFTAVGYFFAREIVKRLHVAVGLINSTWGGTMVETWISRGALEKSPEFKSLIASIPEKDLQTAMKQRRASLEKQVGLLQRNISDTLPEAQWKDPDYNSQSWPVMRVSTNWENQQLGLNDLDGTVWFRKEIRLDSLRVNKPVTLSLGKIDDFDETYVNGIRVGATKNYAENRLYTIPAGIFREGRNVIAVRVEDTGGGGGFYGDSTAVKLEMENGELALGDPWSFRVAKIATSEAGIGPNDFPSLLFNAMIHPLIPYAIRGVLWYQGEANTDRAYQYRTAFPLLIADWRQHWQEGVFPFYFVQLASFNAANGNSERGSNWAELREAQTHTLNVPATGMAVTTDIGIANDIHPKNKQDVGLRLAAIALNNIYGHPMEYSGPVYDSMRIEEQKIVLTFTHTGSGLLAKNKYGYLMGFEIAGADHHFHFAKAYLDKNRVIVYADDVPQPVSVRYAWADDAGDANLFNREGFPAVPFRTDQWKGATDDMKYTIVR
jgi:sialate O-acetylesterase